MAGETQALKGPDLKRDGMPIGDLPDGTTAAGHADGEPVLVTRRGDTCFAVGGVCTHYSGPLSDGLVVGDTVRCPWHHACFSLRTGEALRAPALNPVPHYAVEQRNGRVFVAQRSQSDPLAQSKPAAPRGAGATYVILGAGAAGEAAAEMLRRQGFQGRVLLIGADPAAPYDRPNLSKDYLAGEAPEEWIPLRPPEFYEEHAIDLVLGERADRLDLAGRRLVLGNGDVHPYDRLLLALGAEPVRLEIPGATLPHVHVLRSLAQSRAIIAAAERSRCAVVIGASFIGLEVAASLRHRKLEVHVVAPEERPLARVLGPEIGAFIQRLHEEHGVRFHLGHKPARIDPESVTLDSGERLPADLVVAGVGVRPCVALAERAGLTMDRGISVNAYLETSAPGVFAAGDLARWPDPHTGERIRVEHWVVAQRQGQVAACNMLDLRTPYEDVPFFWSAHYDVSVRYVGHAERWDRIALEGSLEARSFTATFGRGGRRLAVATVGRDRAALEAEAQMEGEGNGAGVR
ncbi:MAG TPA: FAD-dependent oxidoreductase [Gemmatimonadales bacterium]|nr:FAD-dependent oxidoreductase [Gemmatimonadales bacterium]